MSRRRARYRRLLAAAVAAGLIAAPPAFGSPARGGAPSPLPTPAEGPHAWTILAGLTGAVISATGSAGPARVREA